MCTRRCRASSGASSPIRRRPRKARDSGAADCALGAVRHWRDHAATSRSRTAGSGSRRMAIGRTPVRFPGPVGPASGPGATGTETMRVRSRSPRCLSARPRQPETAVSSRSFTVQDRRCAAATSCSRSRVTVVRRRWAPVGRFSDVGPASTGRPAPTPSSRRPPITPRRPGHSRPVAANRSRRASAASVRGVAGGRGKPTDSTSGPGPSAGSLAWCPAGSRAGLSASSASTARPPMPSATT